MLLFRSYIQLRVEARRHVPSEDANFWPLNFGLRITLCWQSYCTPGGATDTKSIIHRAGAWSELISVQSGCNRLKHIRRFQRNISPEEDGDCLAVTHGFGLLLPEHSYKAETESSDRPIYHAHLFCMCKIATTKKKKSPLWEYISYDGINTSECDFIFLTCGDCRKLIIYSIAVPVLLICILHLIRRKSSLNIGCSTDSES